ncbi:chemotaxis protein MotB [Tranquillimonas rosea]|uniref:Chemotaxis protein MotB n=1 Tax=Tranquillimonas rosea TaxID=641238 RepID=A0A1H9PII5_9RHOB|nr:OmpA family protein [Tranquillimonas rosea]SER47659.1 chemotaxis protein MotB [Tranquillimonas rosea]
MRAQARRTTQEEEEESAFVSMTDMTVGFLFIIMILLVFFASQVRTQDVVERVTYDAVVAERDEWRTLAADRADRIAVLEEEKARLIETRDALVRDLAEAQEMLTRLSARLDALMANIAALQLERDTLRTRVAELQDRLQALLAERAELEAQIARLTEDVRERDDRIAELEARIAELEARIADLTAIDPLEAYLARVAETRRIILLRLRHAILLDFPELKVELSEESDALRFQGEGLFVSGRSSLTADKQAIVSRLAERLDEVLPCFTLGPRSRFDKECNAHAILIEAVQIEGHTDDVGSDFVNRNLSTARANTTFFAMTAAAGGLMDHRNLKGQPVLSVAAYGPDRPVTGNDTAQGRATNRRIDLRFIMVTPQDTDGIAAIRRALENSGEAEP